VRGLEKSQEWSSLAGIVGALNGGKRGMRKKGVTVGIKLVAWVTVLFWDSGCGKSLR